MKFLSFKILVLCVLFPPVFYVFSVQYLEDHCKVEYEREIEDAYIGDESLLLDGRIALRDAITQNIDFYLASRKLILWGVRPDVTVATKEGEILYPSFFSKNSDLFLEYDHKKTAANNYKLLNEGINIKVGLKIEHTSLIANTILAFYVVLSLLTLCYFYRVGLKKSQLERLGKNKEFEVLLKLKKSITNKLKNLELEKGNFSSELRRIKRDRIKAAKNENELIEEIIDLESKIDENAELQDEQQKEISTLKEYIKQFEKEKQNNEKRKLKNIDAVRKRFKTLYKNISITDKAISGFIDLADDMKIKGEEIIHQLNENPQIVAVKRKVFSKKSKETVMEVIFAYRGRLYFRSTKTRTIEILTMGTKNVQSKDLEFLNKM